MSRRVVITGLGAVTPVGNNVHDTWESLMQGKSGIATITLFDPSGYGTRFGGEVKDFDPVALFGRKEARRMDRFTQFAMEASRQAIEDACLTQSPLDRTRVATVIGSGLGGMMTFLQQHDVLKAKGPRRVSPFFIPMTMPDSAAARLAIEYGFQGPSMSVTAACATGTAAVGEAFEMVARGAADVAVAGGADSLIIPLIFAGFSVMKAFSTRNDDPAHSCRPFDAERDGFVASEGGATLVLEELEHARARGARIYAEFIGYGASVDADNMAAPLADGSGAALAIRAALQRAGIPPTEVDYINAHGTATRLNDVAETNAIKKGLGEHAYRVAISSTKSMTGHLLGGAGALEALICAKTIQTGVIPPTINYQTPDPDCDLDYVPNVARRQPVRVAMSNSFGFGGHNATILLRAYPA
ncbi:MAG: beta-ketoacyl-[acyl-carrier-protein] synthase II [Caldilineae bacterium]|nr:MAG: beta-ketoacyl-[acyl-carrier-protein] synthase II [Caldilineae bacterium]